MTDPKDERPSLGLALGWASRLMAVSLEMVLPGIFGNWLDQQWGTSFLVIVGFVFGLIAGVWHLLVMVGAIGKRRGPSKSPTHDARADRPPANQDKLLP